jgi:Fur family iron response transcriptional regulator
MLNLSQKLTDTDISAMLRGHGVQPTSQRIMVARVLFTQMTHLSAEDIYRLVNAENRCVSKATVYNTLGLFTKKGVVREVIADPTRVFYDPNTSPHHHFFDMDTGRLLDIDGADVQVSGLPPLPTGTRLEGVDVVVRLRAAAK